MSRPPVLEALWNSRAWINYSPAKPFDFVIGKQSVGEAQLETELRLLFDRGFRGLVTNAMTYGVEAAPRIAKRIGFTHVIAKLWWANDAGLAVEKANVAREIAHIDALVVGNETVHKAVHRGEPAADAVARLREEIALLQRAYGKPVTTGLHRDDWTSHPEIATEVGDFVFANLQPWWVQLRNEPELAARWVAAVLRVMRDTPGMPPDRMIIAQEASFPTGALQPEAAPGATAAAQAIFFRTLVEAGVRFVYGFAFDSYFARKSSPPGGYGGLWDEERRPKDAVSVLDLGPYER